MELDRHIEILLLGNDCVIVPDLGGFMAHHVEARYDETDGMFIPPIRTLGFNPQLKMNDSLLVQSYIEAYDISYPEALRRIEGEVAELRSHLDTAGSYELCGIGMLRVNDEGNLAFEPCEAGILTPQLYGLGAFEMKPLQQPAASAEPAELPAEKAITIKMSWLRNLVCVAAAAIAFFMVGTPVDNSHKVTDMQQQSSFINVPKTPAASRSALPLDLSEDLPQQEETAPVAPSSPSQSETAALSGEELMDTSASASNPAGSFFIVMASQVSERNARLFIGQLEQAGFSDANILVSGSKKIRRVVYGSYETEADAASTLHQLRSESRLFRDAWIMEVK